MWRMLGNLINKNWGRLDQVRFEYFQPVVETTINGAGQYVYNDFGQRSERRITEAALTLAGSGGPQVPVLICLN